jgi:hypothetical protein
MSLSELMTASLKAVVKPWYESLSDPAGVQLKVLESLLEDYSKTEYGKSREITPSLTLKEFRSRIQPAHYNELKQTMNLLPKGDLQMMLPEPPAAWVMTRGTTGTRKILPVSSKHLAQILSCGARAIANHILKTGNLEIARRKVLNLNFPSRTGNVQSGDISTTYGYSSGTYARLNPTFANFSLIPRQEEIDTLGGGITKKNWEARFELTYQLTRNEDVGICMGVAPVITSFARYVKRKHGRYPKEFWKINAIFCTSVPKIHWKYAPVLRSMYGNVPVKEMYTATEGVFAQQLDDLPYVSPNYDTYFFEVITGNGLKMLHEMKRGEWGRLVVSSCILPRYDIEDMIECLGGQYFRVFGRARLSTVITHIFYRIFTKWFI